MRTLLTRLKHLKMAFISLIFIVVGIALIAADELEHISFYRFIPWAELGGILVGAGLLSVWVDHLFSTEQQALNDQRLRSILKEHSPSMRDAVLDAFAANHDDLKRVATPDTLDQIITNSLGLRLDNQEFASEVYADLKSQAVEAAEYWRDLDIAIDLIPHPENDDYFMVTVRVEYSTVPSLATRRFVCVSDKTHYATMAAAKGETSAWYLTPNEAFKANSRDAFELVQFSVDGETRKIRRSTRKDYQAYVVEVGAETIEAKQPVSVSYTYRVVTPKQRHLLFFDIEQPTRNVKLNLDYTATNIQAISAVDQFPATRATRIEHAPKDVPTKYLRVEADGWTFPRAGVAFVWGLASKDRPVKNPGASNALQ